MDTESGRSAPSVSERLFREAYRFEFFQAVRLLERVHRERARGDPAVGHFPVGGDSAPRRESVRFKALPSLSFPSGTIGDLHEGTAAEVAGLGPPEMRVAFMGLTGLSGVLPEHYTDLLIRRIRSKDYALRDFLDLFNHRGISLFYRAWEKYRLPFAWERARLDPSAEDQFSDCVRCLIGLGTAHLRDRLTVSDDVLLYYAGHFAHRPRSAVALEALLSEYLHRPVRVQQFQGHWLHLGATEQTRLPGPACPAGQYQQLGVNAVVGERVWDVRSKFRLRLGPLRYAEFTRLMPGGATLLRLCEIARAYVGPELAFDVQPVLQESEVPPCRLEKSDAYAPRLGWNTWLGGAASGRDAEDAVFMLEAV